MSVLRKASRQNRQQEYITVQRNRPTQIVNKCAGHGDQNKRRPPQLRFKLPSLFICSFLLVLGPGPYHYNYRLCIIRISM